MKVSFGQFHCSTGMGIFWAGALQGAAWVFGLAGAAALGRFAAVMLAGVAR